MVRKFALVMAVLGVMVSARSLVANASASASSSSSGDADVGEADAAVAEALREEVASLRQLSDKYAAEVEGLEAKATECSHDRRALEKELATIKSQGMEAVSEKVKAAKALEEELEGARAELKKLEKRAAETEADMRRATDASLAEKEREAAAKDRAAAEELTAVRAVAEKAAAAAAVEKDALLADVDALRLEVEVLSKKLSQLQAENAKFVEQKASLEQGRKELASELSESAIKIELLEELEASYGVRVERFIRSRVAQTKELAQEGYASATEFASRCYTEAREKYPAVQAQVVNATLSMNEGMSAGAAKMYNATVDAYTVAAAHSSSLYLNITETALPYVDKVKDVVAGAATSLSSSSVIDAVNVTQALDYVRSSVASFNVSAATSYLHDLRISERIEELKLGDTLAAAYENTGATGAWVANRTAQMTAEIMASDTTKSVAREVVLYTMMLRNVVGDQMRAHPQTARFADFDIAVTLALMGLALSLLLLLLVSLMRMCCGRRRRGSARFRGNDVSSPDDESSATKTATYAPGTIKVPPSPTDSVSSKKAKRQSKRM